MVFRAREKVTAASSLNARRRFDLSHVLEREWMLVTLLSLWGLFVYYHHQGIALRGDEAMYASIARRILSTGDWLRLVYEGDPYWNKPPLFFWQIGLSMLLWGPTEFAVRFPTATFGVATMLLVYYCGKALFNRRVGLVAALITTTTTASVFYAHKARFDIPLGFWMTLAVFAFYLTYRGGGRRLGYLSLAFLSMAVAAMLKGPVAFILPGVVALAFLLVTRRSKSLAEIPLLIAGLVGFLLITGTYYWSLGEGFNRHFFLEENLARLPHGSWYGGKKPLFYVYALCAEFFPWSLFLPSVLLSLWIGRSSHATEEDLLIRLWGLGYFFLLSLPSAKSERFLVYLVPPFALLLARYWDHLLSGSRGSKSVEDRFLRITAILLVIVTFAIFLTGPSVLERRFRIPVDFWSLPFALLVGAGCVAVLYTALRSRPQAIFTSVLAVSMAITFGHVQLFYPAMDRYDSAIPISRQLRAIVGHSPLVLNPGGPGWADIVYYLDRPAPVPHLTTIDEVAATFRSDGQVFALLAKQSYDELVRRGNLPLTRVADYYYRGSTFALVSNRSP